MTHQPHHNYYKHFIIRKQDTPAIEGLHVVDAFNDSYKIILEDKRAVRDLIAQLIAHMEDLEG